VTINGIKLAAKDVRLARKVKKYGMHHPYRLVREARRAGITVPLACALVEQETGSCRNVYGHDPVANRAPKGGKVTRHNYKNVYLPDRRRGLGMQGVGPLQLTWYATQDRADQLGGCWKVSVNLRVGFATLASLIKAYGYRNGIKRYNGSGPAADAYAASVIARHKKWHKRLT
jgi:hypothetical protein